MIRVKYNEKFSQDGYDYRNFDNYEDFGCWFVKNHKNITIWDIEIKE